MGIGAGQTESLETLTTPAAELARADRDRMFALYETYYEAIDRGLFERDLSEKDAVVLTRLGREIVGFSTYLVRQQAIGGETVHYLFSGDTVLHASLWGNPVLLKGFFRAAGAAKAKVDGRLFWFPIIKGHRTFRILPDFFRKFVPAIEGQGAPCLLAIRDAIASARYGDYFDPSTGLIDFGPSQGHLREQWADARQTAAHNPLAAFFVRANPDHSRGVELACLTEFETGNLKRYGATSFAEGLGDGR